MLEPYEVRDFRRFLNEASDREIAEKESFVREEYDTAPRETESWYDARFMLRLIAEERQARADLRRLELDRQLRRRG